jgi:hypothetical protein
MIQELGAEGNTFQVNLGQRNMLKAVSLKAGASAARRYWRFQGNMQVLGFSLLVH